MAVKLRIDLSQGVLEIEGDEAIVREIHAEFRAYALQGKSGWTAPARPLETAERTPVDPSGEAVLPNASAKRGRKKRQSQEGGTAKDESYTPRVVRDFDPKGMREFAAQFLPGSHAERILIFAKFLQERGQEVCKADEIFTCYHILKERFPKRFWQAIIDTRGKHSFIDYSSPYDLRITSIGENHFNHDLKRSNPSA